MKQTSPPVVSFSQVAAENTALIESHVRKYADSCDPEMAKDLRQAGLIGLWKAFQRYDPGRGVKFSTYAWRFVRHGVHDEFRRQTKRMQGVPPAVPVVTLEDASHLSDVLLQAGSQS